MNIFIAKTIRRFTYSYSVYIWILTNFFTNSRYPECYKKIVNNIKITKQTIQYAF